MNESNITELLQLQNIWVCAMFGYEIGMKLLITVSDV
jgi:hypothetical protein